MCACNGGCSYELLSQRLRELEKELVEAVESGDDRRILRLRARIEELRSGCRRLVELPG